MKGSVALIYVDDKQNKNRLLQTLTKNEIHFYEALNEDDLEYKIKLLEKKIDIIIMDTQEENVSDKFELISEVKKGNKNLKVLVLLHKYKALYIDQALRAKINDLMIMPFNDEDFIRKVKSLLTVNDQMEELPEGYMQQINNEISRADRGKYPISLILVEVQKQDLQEARALEFNLRSVLRTTDEIMKWDAKRYIIICPFTEKEQIQIVEQKIKETYDEGLKHSKSKKKIYMSGVSYPVDGQEISVLLSELSDGINESMMIDKLDQPLILWNRKK